jgi:phosphorylcholine metabolism protein LicD
MYPNVSDEHKRTDIELIYKILGDVELSPWLMSGALLGTVLHKNTLPGDRDIDFGLMAEDREKFNTIIPDLKKAGFSVLERFDPITQKPKNMVTMQGKSLPIDIKFFVQNENKAYREIHKSLDKKTAIIWEIIDLMHYGQLPFTSRIRKKSNIIAKSLESLTKFIPEKIKQKIKINLSEKWKNSNSIYGVEIHSLEILKETEVAEYAGTNVLILKEWEKYIKEEYGELWRTQKSEGKGGWAKKSHIIFPKSEDELLEKSNEEIENLKISNLLR